MPIEAVDDERCQVGESPVWDETTNRLFWVDILGGVVHCRDLTSNERRRWQMDEPVSALGLCNSGRLVVALRERIAFLNLSNGQLSDLESVALPKPGMRLNDGKVGPDGAFWVGSMDMGDGVPAGALYRVDATGKVGIEAEGLRASNGLAWTADGRTMFHSDSRGPWIDILDFDPATGTASNRRRLKDLDEQTGRPDGGACDMEGNYWSAGISAGRLNRFSPDGTLLDWIDLPIPSPTMPCFGGPDYKTIFITSLSAGKTDEILRRFPLTGTTLALQSDISGVPPFRFTD